MAGETGDAKPDAVHAALSDMKLEEAPTSAAAAMADAHPSRREVPITINGSRKRSTSQSPVKTESAVSTPRPDEHSTGRSTPAAIEPETLKPGKLSRKSSHKHVASSAPLFDHLEDCTADAVSGFKVIRDCIYGSKLMGASEHDALGCDCSESWNDGENDACGEDSDCINRATKIECVDAECNCGPGCQNQRFQRKQYAAVSVIKTEKKGYGLRADADLHAHDFIFEYIGEVINEPTFRRRMMQYDQEGIKHFYFMSLNKSEFVDATKRGNLGRFCNHSCNPNCYVDKWVVGDKVRMGIFAERHIRAGEELVFNYNVDRYGADPQPCYCNEPNCMGFIGGKTQTERATKLSHATIEALGIDDRDGWDTAVAKRPRKKKAGEDDEEYVNSLPAKALTEDGVTKVMATLMQCKEKWIVVKLLARMQRSDDDKVRNRVVRMHGYQILRTILSTFIDDSNVVLQVLDILDHFPRLTRNKISDSNIETVVHKLITSEHATIASESTRLLDEWGKLEVAYRIPRKKFDPSAPAANHYERRDTAREDEARKSPSAAPVAAPTGPRHLVPPRKFFSGARSTSRRTFGPLPAGWFSATDQSGRTYFYDKTGQTTWQRPSKPALELPIQPKAQAKAAAQSRALQDIIDNITRQDTTPRSAATPPAETPKKEKKSSSSKWRALPMEKQMKVYENTVGGHGPLDADVQVFPSIKYVMDKYKHKLPRDDLKKLAKDISKKIVASDYKNKRVDDPTKISSKHEKNVKKHVKEFFDKAVAKKVAHDERRAKRDDASGGTSTTTADVENVTPTDALDAKHDDSDGLDMSDDEGDEGDEAVRDGGNMSDPNTPSDDGLKRKLGELDDALAEPPLKRTKDSESVESSPAPPPPPPPPPPPGDEPPMDMDPEEEDLRKQEEELMRENEEALRQDEKAQQGHTVNGVEGGTHFDAVGGTHGAVEDTLPREPSQVMSH